jgi:ectoine hydroxylase-related dioxygenase (phytanoyl-CoA dioxygenase family)
MFLTASKRNEIMTTKTSILNPTDPTPRTGPRIDVPQILDQNQIDQFVNNGFLIMPDLISPTEIEELKRDTIAIARGEYPCDNISAASPQTSDQQILESILCIHQPHYVSPVMEKYARHQKICGVLSQIVAAHLAHWDGSVKCMQSMLFVKPPGFQGQAWHQDEIYIPTRDRSLCGAWIAMDDATVENGCLWVIPGSHRPGYLYPQHPHDNPDEFDVSSESYGFDDNLEIPVEVKSGAVVFFNGYLLHRSRKNRSQIYRRVLVNHYMNAWSLLPWQIRQGETAANADFRSIIPVAGADPYSWKGTEPPPQAVSLRRCKAGEEVNQNSL